MSDVLVTFNETTIATALVAGFLLGYFVVNETVETVLEHWLTGLPIRPVVGLVPMLVLLIGLPVIFTFYSTSILTDILTGSPNNVFRAAGRGLGNTVFLLALVAGSWLDIRRSE